MHIYKLRVRFIYLNAQIRMMDTEEIAVTIVGCIIFLAIMVAVGIPLISNLIFVGQGGNHYTETFSATAFNPESLTHNVVDIVYLNQINETTAFNGTVVGIPNTHGFYLSSPSSTQPANITVNHPPFPDNSTVVSINGVAIGNLTTSTQDVIVFSGSLLVDGLNVVSYS